MLRQCVGAKKLSEWFLYRLTRPEMEYFLREES